MEIWYNHANLILIFVVFALSLNLLLGYAGQVSVAHAAFGAVGGYAYGYMAVTYHWNLLGGIVFGMLVAFGLGMLLALPSLKLSVEYLILLTLAVSSVIIGVFTTFKQLGGTYGLIGIPQGNVFGQDLAHPSDWIPVMLVVAAIVYLVCWRIGESPYGRVLKGIREDGLATQALGKNVFRFKVVIFGVASMLAGLAGALYSAYIQLATPGVFGFSISLAIFVMVIFGGMANLTGSIIGAIVVQGAQPILERVVHLSPDRASFVRLAVYGLLLVVLMRLRPQGVLPEGVKLHRLFVLRRKPKVVVLDEEGWTPKVPDHVAVLAEAEAEYLDSDTIETGGKGRDKRWYEAPVVLEVTGLSKRFGGIVAADRLDLQLRKGTITALVGPNGAGKTTVFNLLTGFIRPDGGRVVLNGKDLFGYEPDKVARLGMVRSFQDVRLFMRLSCLENVAMAVQDQPGEMMAPLFFTPGKANRASKAAREKALEWLSFVGMQDFADVPAAAISYGQSKLVSMARVLATEADVLLLDEPASGIDTNWVDTVLGLVEAVREQGRTICIVEHNLHVVGRLSDHVYFMELGRITAQGSIEELTHKPELAEAYFGTG
jgi:branched-chain amino acid transport system permease protein